MNKKWMTGIAVVTFGAALAVAAPQEKGTQEHFGHHGHHHGFMSEKLAQKLNLTDAQKQQIKDIKKASHAENAAFFQSARETWKAAHAAKEANDTAKLDALKPQLDAQKAQMKSIRKAEKDKILAVLTPEQRSTLEQLKAQRAAKRAEKSESK